MILKSSLQKSKEPPSASTVLRHLSVPFSFFLVSFYKLQSVQTAPCIAIEHYIIFLFYIKKKKGGATSSKSIKMDSEQSFQTDDRKLINDPLYKKTPPKLCTANLQLHHLHLVQFTNNNLVFRCGETCWLCELQFVRHIREKINPLCDSRFLWL